MTSQTKRRSIHRLGIYMNGASAGFLERQASGALSFGYSDQWLARETAFAISRRFPLNETPYRGDLVRWYFDNLLPDEKGVRERLAAHAHAQGTQSFDILAALGRDCVGALQVYPEDEKASPVGTAKGYEISTREITSRIKNLRVNPLGIDLEQDFRISLAGAQSKTALLKMNGKWFVPKGATPTTHILKPAIGHVPGGPDLSLSVENEWLCLKIIRAFGLPTAEAEIAHFGDMTVLVVERFDRQWSGKKLFRLAQEDVCQALGIGPERKYESDGGPGIKEILALLNESNNREEDRRTFMKSQLIFWLLGAIDGHAKNFSLAIRPGGFALTPIYDVMSADPHVNPKTLPEKKIKLAMSVGKNRHRKLLEILPRHWQQTAAQAKFPKIDELMREVASQFPAVLETVSAELPKKFPAQVADTIFEAMEKRVKRLSVGRPLRS
jgi:serine/threonine-protein kinase HipA